MLNIVRTRFKPPNKKKGSMIDVQIVVLRYIHCKTKKENELTIWALDQWKLVPFSCIQGKFENEYALLPKESKDDLKIY